MYNKFWVPANVWKGRKRAEVFYTDPGRETRYLQRCSTSSPQLD